MAALACGARFRVSAGAGQAIDPGHAVSREVEPAGILIHGNALGVAQVSGWFFFTTAT